jgi:NAD(P)H dehydrogenase (quinone)
LFVLITRSTKNQMKIGITGATGQLGKIVVAKLKEKLSSENLVALVRSPSKAADLGIEARAADYDKPETLESAFLGIDTLLLISASEIGKRETQHRNVIEAATRTGVKWIIYTSILHADTSTISLAEEHLASEADLKSSNIPFTILRHGWYTENYTASIAGALSGGAFVGSAGTGKISSAARADYAEADVAILTTTGHKGKIYELAGDDAWTLNDLAAEISRQAGKDIPYVDLPEAEYTKALVGFGLPEELAVAIAGWDVAASQGDLFDDDHQLSKLIRRPTTPLAVVVADALKALSAKNN